MYSTFHPTDIESTMLSHKNSYYYITEILRITRYSVNKVYYKEIFDVFLHKKPEKCAPLLIFEGVSSIIEVVDEKLRFLGDKPQPRRAGDRATGTETIHLPFQGKGAGNFGV